MPQYSPLSDKIDLILKTEPSAFSLARSNVDSITFLIDDSFVKPGSEMFWSGWLQNGYTLTDLW
jgi:hypothetical protein